MRFLYVFIFSALLATGAYANHREMPGANAEWFCSPAVEEYIHELVPLHGQVTGVIEKLVSLLVMKNGLPVAFAIHKIDENGGLGPTVYFETIPGEKVLCDKLPKGEPA